MKRYILLFLLMVSMALPAKAADDQLDKVMTAFQQVKAANAHFTERKQLQMLSEPLESTGTLTYTAPDSLEKITLVPKPERLTVKADTLTIERDGQTHELQLQDYPEIAGFVESIRATLAGDLPTLSRFYTVNFQGNLSAWQIALQPIDPKVQELVQSIQISGREATIQKIETLEGNGDHSEMLITVDHP